MLIQRAHAFCEAMISRLRVHNLYTFKKSGDSPQRETTSAPGRIR